MVKLRNIKADGDLLSCDCCADGEEKSEHFVYDRKNKRIVSFPKDWTVMYIEMTIRTLVAECERDVIRESVTNIWY